MEKTSLHGIRIPAAIFAAAAFVPFFEPNGLSFVRSIDLMWTGLMGLAFAAAFILYARKGAYSSLFLVMLLWRTALLFSTVFVSGTVHRAWISRTAMCLGIIMTAELLIRYDPISALEGLYAVCMANLVLNLLTCLSGGLLRSGGQLYYWSGIRTRFTDSVIPALTLAFLLSWKKRRRLLTPLTAVTILVAGAQLGMKWVATGVFILAAMVILIVPLGKRMRELHAAFWVILPLVVNFLVVFARILDLFRFLIVDILHKSMTLHGRIPIWNQFSEKILRSPLLGYGEIGNGGAARVWWSQRLLPAHNSPLQILHDGGAVSLILFLFVFILAAAVLSRVRSHETALIISVGMMAVGFEMLTEVVQYYPYFYILPVLAMNARRIDEQTERKGVVIYLGYRRKVI